MPRLPDPDFEIFLKDPNAILLKYQGLIQAIVHIYVEQGMFSPTQKEDVIQSVNLEILRKIPSLQRHYNGSALLRTYFSAIVRNICLQLKRTTGSPLLLIRNDMESDVEGGRQHDRYSIQQARDVFEAILVQLGPVLPKLLICLKLRYRYPLTRRDIQRWWPACGGREKARLLEMFGGDYGNMIDKEIHPLIVPYFNAAEGKVSGADALRKWQASKIQKILKLLQEAIPGSSFDEESLQILFEDYLSPFLLRE
jgi:DNA-directed RNA polymerase specialized sigma24 family protein